MISVFRKITHLLLPVKRSQYRFIKSYSKKMENKKILEIGAGQGYKVENFFPQSNEYIKTDLVSSQGVRKLDITKDKINAEYDVIVCLNVLEHIFDYKTALNNIYNSLKIDGVLFFSVPLFYPLHMLPDDYWRFTPSALERLFIKYRKVIIQTSGIKYFPYNVNVLAIK